MSIGRIEPISTPQSLPLINTSGDESKVFKETGTTVVTRQDESAKAGSEANDQEMTKQEAEKLADRINRIMGLIDKRLQFSIHEKSGQIQVKVIDQQSGEVLDEIPPKRLLDLMASFRDMTGILVDHKA